MADIFEGQLTITDDWGKVIRDDHPEGIPASGQSVQEFIKTNIGEIAKKPTYFHSVDDGDKNQNVLLAFENESKFNEWEQAIGEIDNPTIDDYINGPNVLTHTRLNKAQPTAYNSVLLENKMDSSTIISTDNTVKIKIKFSSTHYEPSGSILIPSPTGEEGTLIMQRRTGQGTWETKLETTIRSIDAEDKINYTEVDLTEYLVNGFQEIQIIVTGNTTGLSTSWLKYDVTKTNLGLVFATPWQIAQTTNKMQLSYYINGAVDKTLNIKITGPGGDGSRTYTENIGKVIFTETSGTPKKIDITDSNLYNYKVVTEGVHTVEAWLSVNNTNIESAHIYSQVLMVPGTAKKPYIIINDINTKLTNWTNQTLFKYALYSPYGDTMPISFTLGDYNTDDIYLKYESASANCEEIFTLSNTIEIETEESLFAKMDIMSEDSMSQPIQLLDSIEFQIENNKNYSPTKGADFIFNPKSRNNDEEFPKYVFNAVDGSKIEANWSDNVNFTTDGWVNDSDGVKCLRILSGQTLEIDYNPFEGWGADNSCTIEMVIAARNISSEEYPIINLSRETDNAYNGLKVWPTKAIYKTPSSVNDITQDILFREGVPTHIAINIMHNMYTYDIGGKSNPIHLVRIFVNGVINREFAYDDSTLGDIGLDLTNPRKIIFGNSMAGADLDVYSMRIYKSKLSSSDILQDYIASLPTTTEKDLIILKNDILDDNGKISYTKVREKYNTILWKYSENEQKAYEDPNDNTVTTPPATRMVGLAEGNHEDSKDTRQYGDLVIRVFNDDGTVDTDRSGTLNDMSAQGQGTSSMGYWKWNQRWVFQKKGEDKDKDDIKSKYTTTFKAENPNSSHNGKKSWQPFVGAPFAKKLDAKINWASPMQSHKIGSTGMYNDLWKSVVKDNEITKLGTSQDGEEFTGTAGGYADCRVTVGQVPFMVFCQKTKESEPEFYGLYTMGPSKGDKPTFGYNDDNEIFKNFSMIEGCDNGALLVTGQVPWNDIDIKLDKDGEIFMYNNTKQYELSMGETGQEYVDESPTIASFKEWNRFVYLLNPNLKYFNGTLSQLLEDASLDQSAFYWTTQKDSALGADSYNVYRYDLIKKRWVNAGIEYVNYDETSENNDYEIVNLKNQLNISIPKGTYAEQNQTFINKRAELFKDKIEEWFDKDDFLFTMCFIKLIAASDNWAKNTYIYNAGFTDEDGKLTSKWRFFQDDLDTIFSLDNSGYKVKPYYVEEHDKKPDNTNYFNADQNALYCLAELAWKSDLRAMMNRILSAATALGGSVIGCFDKYYNRIPKYFPKHAYNEIAYLLYENGYINQKLTNYKSTTNPLAQAVGDQLEAEYEWQRLRSIYMSSYAQFGEFSAADKVTSAGALNFRSSQITDEKGNTQNASYRFEFTPHMWLYPSIAVGQSSWQAIDSSDSTERTKHTLPPRIKAGDKVVFVVDSGNVDGNTQMFIRGINYYKDIGDLGNVVVNNDFTFGVAGTKLTQFKATDEGLDRGMTFRPLGLNIPVSGMDNIEKFIIRGKVMPDTIIVNNQLITQEIPIATGSLDLSGLWRLKEVDVTATSSTNVVLPQNSNITSLKLPKTIEILNLSDQQKLKSVDVNNLKRVNTLRILNSPELNSYDIINKMFENKAQLKECYVDNINWEVSIEQLKYLINIYDCNLKGVIKIKEGETLDFDLKAELLNKFGNIDSQDNDLYVDYEKNQINVNNSRINGEIYVYKDGTYKYNIIANGNDFVGYSWSISANDYAEMSKDGTLTYKDKTDGGARSAVITCSIDVIVYIGGNPGIDKKFITKTIEFKEKEAKIGDVVYSDGSISSYKDRNLNKKIVGVCFYVNGEDRRMIALDDIASQVQWGLTETLYDNNNEPTGPDIVGIDNISSLGSYNGSDLFGYRYHLHNLENLTSSNTLSGSFGTKTLSANKVTPITDYGITSEYNMGEEVPMGLYNTLEIIDRRNEVMTKFMSSPSSSYPSAIPGVVYKYDLEGNTIKVYDETIEMQDLEAKLAITRDDAPYYPAASYCYAYEPDSDDLDEKFKRHNWYLPSYGELAQVFYHEHTNSEFSSLINQNIYNKLSACTWTSSESSPNSAWVIIPMYNSTYGDYLAVEAHTKNITKGYQVDTSYIAHTDHGGFLVRPAARF